MSAPAPRPCAAFAHASLLAATVLASTLLICGSLQAQPFLPDGGVPLVGDALVYAQGDLDGDGWQDVVVSVVDSGNRYVATLMGNGASFDPPAIYPDPDFIHHDLEVVDVDGDGLMDLVSVGRDVAATSDPGRIAVFLNNGGGVLATPFQLSLPQIPRVVTSADMNADGRVDIVVVADDNSWLPTDSSRLLSLLSDGEDGFLPPATIELPSQPVHVTAGDVDGDGAVDLVVSCFDPSVEDYLLLLLNDGQGGFAVSSIDRSRSRYDFVGYMFAAIEDLDADGQQDVIASWFDQADLPDVNMNLRVFSGRDTGGSFDALPPVADWWLWSWLGGGFDDVHRLVSGDLDEDVDLDILVLGSGFDGRIRLVENQGGSVFQEHLVSAPSSMLTGGLIDYEGDGFLDLVGVTQGQSLVLYRNNFENHVETFEQSMTVKSSSLAHLAEDMDGDGDTDVVSLCVDYGGYWLSVFANDGAGSLAPLSPAVGLSPSTWYAGIQAADIDGDGDADVVVEGEELRFFLNDGAGVLASAATLSPSGDAFTLGDLDGDDLLEMIVTWESDGGLSVFHQTSPGQFELSETYGEDEFSVEDVQFGDTDGDGHVDVVFKFTSLSDAPGFGVFAGDGLGGLVEPAQLEAFAPGDTVRDVVVADLDDDGLADVAMTCTLNGSPHLGVYLGEPGSALPLLAQDVVTASSVHIEAITDLDVDGALDLLGVATGAWPQPAEPVEVTVWINDGAGQLTATEPFASFHQGAILIGDVDADGSPDLVTADFDEGVVTVRRNDGQGRFPDAVWSWLPAHPWSTNPTQLTPMDANLSADLLCRTSIEGVDGLSVYLSVYEGTPPGPCELDFNGDGVVTQADHYQIAPVVDGIYYATYTYLYRPDWFELYFPDVDPATLDWDGDGLITLEEVAPNVPFSTDSYYSQWLVYLLRDWIIENYGIDYYLEWWPDSGC